MSISPHEAPFSERDSGRLPRKTQLSFPCPPDLHARLLEVAKRYGLSLAETIRQGLSWALDAEGAEQDGAPQRTNGAGASRRTDGAGSPTPKRKVARRA